MNEQATELILPKGWEWVKLEDICVKASSSGTPENIDDEFVYLDIGGIDNKTNKIVSHKIYKWREAPSRAKQIVKAGDILFSTVRTYLKNIAFVDERYDNQIASTGFCVIRPIIVENKYIYYLTLSNNFLQPLNELQTGSSYPAIRDSDVFNQRIPFPPLNEQRKIVTKIEELFSQLDSSISNLKQAQQQLEVYRQVLLKHAFEGKLTKQWRKENSYEPADKLLARIKDNRQKKYEQQLTDWKVAVKQWEKEEKKGNKPGKPNKPNLFPEFTADELNQLPILPSTWIWTKLGNATDKIFDGTHFSPRNTSTGKYKYITAKNIKESGIDLADLTYVSEADHKEIYSRADVKKGDVLYIKDGATTGIAAVNNLEEEFSLLSSVGVFRVLPDTIIPKYLCYYLNAEVTRKRMLSNVAGVAITRLTLIKLNHAALVLAPFKEQELIITILDNLLSMINNLDQFIKSSLEQSQVLRQSILQKAFEGRLSVQDPNDEAVAILLKQIRAEKDKYLERQKQVLKSTPKRPKAMSKKEQSIEKILHASQEPLSAKDVWQQSKHKESIEDFYDELKSIQDKIIETREGNESFLYLSNEDR